MATRRRDNTVRDLRADLASEKLRVTRLRNTLALAKGWIIGSSYDRLNAKWMVEHIDSQIPYEARG